MTNADYAFTALCLYREARGEGNAGMNAVACVIRNRTIKNKMTPYAVVTRRLQFSSMTSPNDPQLTTFPLEVDLSWEQAQLIAQQVLDGSITDVTGGATLYYDDSISFPSQWNKARTQATVKVGKLNFFKEI